MWLLLLLVRRLTAPLALLLFALQPPLLTGLLLMSLVQRLTAPLVRLLLLFALLPPLLTGLLMPLVQRMAAPVGAAAAVCIDASTVASAADMAASCAEGDCTTGAAAADSCLHCRLHC